MPLAAECAFSRSFGKCYLLGKRYLRANGSRSFTICGTFIELFSPNWKVWIGAKVFYGLAMGLMQGSIPTYVSELCPIPIRGFMLSAFQLWLVMGSFLSSCILEGTQQVDDQWSWKGAVVSQFGLSAICLGLYACLTPESPYFLVENGRSDKARAVLLRLRGGEKAYNVERDLGMIQETLDHERAISTQAGSYFDCFRGTDLRRTCIACLPMLMQQFMGFPFLGNYISYFLTLSGVRNAFVVTVIANCLSMFGVIVSFTLIEKVGRRPQMTAGSLGMLPCLLVIGIIGFTAGGSKPSTEGVAALCIIWSIFYYMSVGAVGWTLVGEVSSLRLRSKTNSVATIANAMANMGWSLSIPYLVNADEANLGPKSAFIFFFTGIIFGIMAFLVIPETKGKSFSELDAKFEAHIPARKF